MDPEWLHASRYFLIFSVFPGAYTHRDIKLRKNQHLQFFFWTALDRANRRFKDVQDPNERLWEFHDMHDGLWRSLLLGSPWFDCPIFEDLLFEIRKKANGEVMLDKDGNPQKQKRDPRSEELEEAFFDRWWYKASKLPLRRFPNGDAVLPISAPYFRDMYGHEAMAWEIGETEEVAVEAEDDEMGDEAGDVGSDGTVEDEEWPGEREFWSIMI
ncbi:hypothetical protein F66182_4761 [Fusarium sp. NRRL 66182]|nr:hypothetical protein F66182_4761 [Fusarium sp. NRRL 66182]